MKITKIVQQVKQKDRYSIYVDDKYAFSLSETALIEQRVASGQELDAAELETYKKLSADDKVYNRALRYVAMRMRSEGELRDYLRRKQVTDETADQVMVKLQKLGFVDDVVFARQWVQNRRLLKPTSKRRLVQELKLKHIDDTIISDVLIQDDADEKSVLQELVAKKLRQPKYQYDQLKLMQYLARQGFGYDDIKSVLSELGHKA